MSYKNISVQMTLDSTKNSLTLVEPVPFTNMFGMVEMKDTKLDTYIFDTDYATYVAGAGCIEKISFWDPKPTVYFFIAVRDRGFDSLRTLGMIAAKAPFTVDQNMVVFPYSGPNCKN